MSRVIVVGAGLAGLAAADALVAAGIEPLVLEARERVGGRVASRRLDGGAVVELGAEFILPGCTELRAEVERFGLGLWDKGMRYGNREPRGVEIAPGDLERAATLIDEALASGASGSAAELLAALDVAGDVREAVRARCEVSAAASAEDVPAAELGLLARISDEPAPSVAGGNDRLPAALAAELGERVVLGAAVEEIRWGPGGVTAVTAAGEHEGDACVVTAPATVLGRIGFEPELPPTYAETLGSIGYGHAAKLFVPLAAPAAPSATLAVPERYWAWTATGEEGRPQPVLSAFAGSPAALARLGVSDGPGAWLESLARLRPDLELRTEEAVLANWDADPWVGAAYSLELPPLIRRELAEPLGRLAFAGEHLAPEMGALMEGAIRSGRHAAGRIAAELGGRGRGRAARLSSAAMGLQGNVVFVTGAARGIGAAVAAESARRGARVALAGLEPEELAARAEAIGAGTPWFECDVTDMESVEAAVAGTVEAHGGIDVVLANAGIGTYGTVEKGDPEAWLRTIDINLNGVYRTVRAALPHILASRGYVGVVASVSSFAPSAGMSSYTASKAGVEAFVRALRQEVGFRGVAAGSIHPGWIDTDLVRESERDLPSFRAARARMPWPLKSTTSVEDCARAIVDGFEKRSSRVFVPRGVSLLYWLRSLVTSDAAERGMTRDAAEMVPMMEEDIARLGRSTSARTAEINSLPESSATKGSGRS